MRRMLSLLLLTACSSSAPAPVPTAGDRGTTNTATNAATIAPGVELPEVALHGYAVADRAVPAISISPTAVSVAGVQVIALRDGAIAPADRDGPGLRDALAKRPAGGPLIVSVDRRATLRVLVDALTSAGQRQAQLLARAGAYTVAAPIAIADPSASAPVVLTITADHVRLGTAGDAFEAAVGSPTLATDLGARLLELATRVPGRQLAIHAVGATPIQLLAAVIGAARATPEGQPLYPDVSVAIADR